LAVQDHESRSGSPQIVVFTDQVAHRSWRCSGALGCRKSLNLN
jgi:hypothetical protein